MINNFQFFANAVQSVFKTMSQETLLVVNAAPDMLWQTYLDAFPEGTDPIFRKRTEHDCSCCRNFVKNIGNVVAMQNGALISVWDVTGLPEPYQTVANAMSAFVKKQKVNNLFLSKQPSYGVAHNKAMIDETVYTFEHFAIRVPATFYSQDADEKKGIARTTVAVMQRGFEELDIESVETVVSLIESNALYRGAEFLTLLREFQKMQIHYLDLVDDTKRQNYLWANSNNFVGRLRNTALGTLLQDLSEGKDLEKAVRAYETIMAPANYKRPTALVTKSMIDSALKTLEKEGLEPALTRRHATFSDVDINSVLFVDNSVTLKNDLRSKLLQEAKPVAFVKERAVEISIADFEEKVLPKTTSLQLYLENNMTSNMVSLTAPVEENVPNLFKWDNNFAWSYEGNVTDSIKDRVKRAGGKVDDVLLRVSLAWSNTDDLDLHMICPHYGRVYFGAKQGILDVDMNVTTPLSSSPVENMRWDKHLPDGNYEILVHNFRRRESSSVGFEIEIEHAGKLYNLSHKKAVAEKCYIAVANLQIQDSNMTMRLGPLMEAESATKEVWGLKTQQLVKVNSVVLSPNYWDGNSVGNKHHFFVLDKCANPTPTRGIYNEFLNSKLDKHRKVFEVLGDKTKCPVTDVQMSGVGFSSTKKDKVTVVATGPNLNKIYTVAF